MVLAASATGAFAATVSGGLALTYPGSADRPVASTGATPFGYDALSRGVSVTSAGGAVAGDNVEFDENIYRVRVTIANVGANKGNTGKPLLLAVDTPNTDTNADQSHFTQLDDVSNASVWRFNQAADGKYTIACNVGQYIGFIDSSFDPEAGKVADLTLRTSVEDAYKFDVAAAENGEGVTVSFAGKYLAMDADGNLSFADNVTDNAVWKLSRAYDESLDLPVVSTDENPVFYTLRNQVQGFLTIDGAFKDSGNDLNCGTLDEYSYWYFVDSGEGNGSFRLKNKNNNIGIRYTTSNGNMKAVKDFESNSMLFFMLDGNEANGWSISCKPYDHLTSYGYQTIHAMMYYPFWNWVMGAKPDDNRNNIGLFSWIIEPTSSEGDEADFVELNSSLLQLFSNYLAYTPWCRSLLNNTLSELSNTAYDGPQSVSTLEKIGNDALAEYAVQINREAQGYNVKISNIRRSAHENVATLGHYLTTVGEGADLTVNTTNTLERNPGFWKIESVDGNEASFRLRNQNGVYLCAASNGSNVATTTDRASAGMYSFVPYEGYIRIVNADNKEIGLNVDTRGNTLVGYDYKDAGSTWRFESVAVIEHVEGMPRLSNDDDIFLYLIRSATDDLDYLQFAYDGMGLCHLPRSVASYCYFLPANDGSDGIQIVCYEHNTRLAYSTYSYYPYSRDNTSSWNWDTNPYFNWYLIPNGTVPEGQKDAGKTCFAISYRYPAEDNTCITKKSSYPGYDYYMGHGGSVEDWEYTGWFFEEADSINHEAIFNESRDKLAAEAKSYKNTVPWCQDMLTDMYETIANARMTDYAPSSTEAVNNLTGYFNTKRLQIEEALELEAEGTWVSIANNRRRGAAETGAYLTPVDGYLNTVDQLSDAGIWNFIYHSNGRYNLVNAEGQYMGELSDRVNVTANEEEAGKYALRLLGGYLCLVDRSDYNNRALNVNNNQGDACVYGPADAGSFWIAEFAVPSGIESIEADDAANDGAEYYNLTGVKVAPEALVPGVYMRVSGTKAVKVLVK